MATMTVRALVSLKTTLPENVEGVRLELSFQVKQKKIVVDTSFKEYSFIFCFLNLKCMSFDAWGLYLIYVVHLIKRKRLVNHNFTNTISIRR